PLEARTIPPFPRGKSETTAQRPQGSGAWSRPVRMPLMHAIGVDVGTTNVKAALVADDGTLLASAHRPLHTQKKGEVAEQDADAMWAQLADAVRELTAAHPAEAAAVGAFGVCTQYSSIVA